VKITKFMSYGLGVAWRSKRLILLFFVANLTLGWLAVRPLDRGLQRTLSHSTWSQSLEKQFDMTFLVDFGRRHGDAISATWATATAALFVYFFVNLFLVGGAIGVFHAPELFRGAAGAFAAGGAYFGRMFRLFLWELPFFLLLILGNMALSAVVMGMAGRPASEATIFIGYIVVYLLLFGLFLLIDMIFDYGKIRAVVEDERRGVRNLAASMRFVFAHFGVTTGLYGGLFLLGIVLLGVYLLLSGWIHAATTATIFALVVVQQLFVLSRVWLKLAFLGGQLRCYQALAAPAVAPAPDMPVGQPPEMGSFA